MSETVSPAQTKSMDDIVALCRRRGFIFQSSEIYGGINGFWDYGPLGAELKRNLKNAWWEDVVHQELLGPDGKPVDVVGLDSTIIMNPKVWIASGHVGGFNDPMVDDKETKQRFRADHLVGVFVLEDSSERCIKTYVGSVGEILQEWLNKRPKFPGFDIVEVTTPGGAFTEVSDIRLKRRSDGRDTTARLAPIPPSVLQASIGAVPSPFTDKIGTLTEPRQFNLMFETYVGAVRDEESKAYLRPETAQGIFVNFWNVLDSTRVKVPFGIAQVGKAFRNEVTPRNFTFRSREFEQMEIEFFIHPDTAREWYAFWRDTRFNWWKSIGLAGDNLQLREHEKDELAHYAKTGAGTSDIEYRFPFTAPGFGELEGVAHRADFDLKAHAEHCGKGDKMMYFDQDLQVKLQNEGASKEEIQQRSRYFPHVIEPSGGADRGTLAVLCEAYTPDESRASKVFMKFNPRLAPVKAAIFPLVNKDGMPEKGEKLYRELRRKWVVEFDPKQSIGKRYARMDEAGTPYCFTIDGDTMKDDTVTVRHRDTQQQERIGIGQVGQWLAERIGG